MEKKKICNPFGCKSLGNGRFEFSLIVNFKLLGVITLWLAGLTVVGLALYWLGVLLWSIKWWVLGASALALIIWGLSKVNWKAIKLPKGNPNKKRNLGWLWWMLVLIIVAVLAVLLLRGCDKDEATVESSPTEVITETVVTEERFCEPGAWIILDAYLSEGFNVKYADYKKFEAYGEVLSYEERVSMFDSTAYLKDWGTLFKYLAGQSFSNDQLAAVQRYGLWCGLAGFEASPLCEKLEKGEDIVGADLAKVYTKDGVERKFSSPSSREHALRYAWVLMNVFDGNISIEELKDLPVKSYESIDVNKMYDADGNYVFNEELYLQLKAENGNRTTREILML